MMIMNNVFTRVSIRRYQDRPVEKEKTEAILRAAMQAPSAANQQPWEFYVVTSREKLEALSEVHPYAGMTRNAPAAIVSVYRKDCRIPAYAQIDLSIAMENLWLETDAQGLGGVWLGIAPIEERMKAVEEILDLPDTVRAFAVFPYGYPAEERKQQDRFDESRIHYVE
jgi:nitroreductase